MSLLKLKAEQAGNFAPRDLFGDIVVGLLDRASSGDTGTLVVEVSGEQGGAWTVDFDGRTVFEGAGHDPDCRLRLTPKGFGDLVRGRLDAEAALESGDFACYGDIDVLVRFSTLLTGA